MGSTVWCASIGGGVHNSYTNIGCGEHLAEMPASLARQPLDIGLIGDRIPTLCPKMKAHGVCRLPNCPYRHELFGKKKSADRLFGGITKQLCKDVPCRFAVALGTCPYGGSDGNCSYCHKRPPPPPSLGDTGPLLNPSLPGPVPGTGRQDGTFSEPPRSETPTLASAAASAAGSRPPSAIRTWRSGPGSRPCSAQRAACRQRPISAASHGSRGSRGGSARSSSGGSSVGPLGRRVVPELTFTGWDRDSRPMLSGKVPPLDLKASSLLFRGGC